MKLRAFATGAVAFALLLALYFLLVGLVSGFEYALEQFATYWYFLVALAAGFGAQMGLYTYLKRLVANSSASKKVVAVSGTTSTAAMISCCAHYLTNILPVLGATGWSRSRPSTRSSSSGSAWPSTSPASPTSFRR